MCGLNHCTIVLSACLNAITVYARGPPGLQAPLSRLLLTVVIDVLDVESVYMARDIPEDCQRNIDAQIGAAPGYDGDTRWGD